MSMARLMDELANLNAEAEYVIGDCDAEEMVEVYYAIKELRPILNAMLTLIKRYGDADDEG